MGRGWEWTDWQPMPELRFAVPDTTTTSPPRLQQKWTRTSFFQVIDVQQIGKSEEEWRDVPCVVVGQSMTEPK